MPSKLSWFGDRAKAAVMAEVDRRMDAAGRAIVARAKELVPVDTGKLRDSIHYQFRQSDMTLTIYADMDYSMYVEFGTSRMSARPYLRPAIAEAAAVFGSSTFTTAMQFGGPGN